MPALAPPPAPARVLAPTPETDSPSVPFFGRSLAEYTQSFRLDLAALRGRDVLDVAAGPSSFTAEACARKIDAVAVDPMYGCPAASLATHVQIDSERAWTQLRTEARRPKSGVGTVARVGVAPGLADGGRQPLFASAEAAHADRRAAAVRFLSDYETHFVHGRYVGGALPRLPFFDGTFDVVLCGYLLFSVARAFDHEWHLNACRELVRVSASEVRVAPVSTADGKPLPGVARLRRELRAEGIASELIAVDDVFLAGGSSVLVLRRAAP